MADRNTTTATRADHRARLRELFGSGRFRIAADGRIDCKTAQRGGWMPWGRIGDPDTERRLFSQPGDQADARPPVGALVVDFAMAAREIHRRRRAAAKRKPRTAHAAKALAFIVARDVVRARAHAAL